MRIKTLAIIFLGGLALSNPTTRVWAGPDRFSAQSSETLPHYRAVMDVIRPLEYSGFYPLVRPRVTLSIDFEQRTWTLHGIRTYDNDGTIILEQARYGLCAELSAYVYGKVKSLFGDRYELKFGNVREAGFFVEDLSNHVVVLIHDKATRKDFLIDPSFHKYGELQDFLGYKIFGINDTLSFLSKRFEDVTYKADQGMPLYIKDDALVSFSIQSVDGRFDRDNFVFVVSVDYRFKGQGPKLLMLARHKGDSDRFENKDLIKEFMSSDDLSTLNRQLTLWFAKEIVGE